MTYGTGNRDASMKASTMIPLTNANTIASPT